MMKLSRRHKNRLKRVVQVGVILLLILKNIFTGLSDRPEWTRDLREYPARNLLTRADNVPGYFGGLERRLERFIRRWEIPGASVAIARNGKLVYAGGMGYADMDTETPAEPLHLFRIASVSKLITAAAVFHLVDEGKLSLDSRVFGPEGILDTTLYPDIADPRALQITVGHLLDHSGGWTTRWGDHMFIPDVIAEEMGVPPPPSIETIIAFALGKPLHFTPGSWSSYSNLGYAILGEVVEQVSGMEYERYVRQELMEPLGIRDFYIAGNTREEASVREVSYYETGNAEKIPSLDGSGELVPRSNGGNDVRTLGGAGGWIATSVDLVKFILSIDGMDSRPDILSRESVWKMTEGSGIWGPLGWRGMDYHGNWYRTGSFAGSSAIAERRADSITWVVLMNGSAWKGADFPLMVRQEMQRILHSIKNWPEVDLFLKVDPALAEPLHSFP
ncbi:MAG TPA: class A beta-lactamase-related serine hydrolase [Bacteroidetes bacterium]|nr:class A beta-lactamase-related serine hydrolase [Bacteroidota bacterium]